MAWRLAIWPTSRSPSSVKPTIEGVVRAPSRFGMTWGEPTSTTATHEFVVPRSMPRTLPTWRLLARVPGSPGRRDLHARGPQEPVVEKVPFLEYLEHRARRDGFRLLAHDGLVNVRVERKVRGRHLHDAVLLERVGQLPRDHVDARVEFVSRGVGAMGERALEIVDDAQDVGERLGEREPEILGLVFLGPALQVVEIRRLPEQRLANAARVLLGTKRAFALLRDLILEDGQAGVRHGRLRRCGLGLGGRDGDRTRAFALAVLLLDGLDGALGLGERAGDVAAALALEENDVFVLAPRLLRAAHAAPSVSRRLT